MQNRKRTGTPKAGSVSYAKWGYIFILPFFLVYIVFTLIPQVLTIYNSFFENYLNGLKQVGPTFQGFKNYTALFTPDFSGSIGNQNTQGSPYQSGTMTITKNDTYFSLIVKGVLKNGYALCFHLYVPADQWEYDDLRWVL